MDKRNSVIHMNKLLTICFLVAALGHTSFSQDDMVNQKADRERLEARISEEQKWKEAHLPIMEESNFSIDIASKKNQFYGGESIQVNIALKNNGGNKTQLSLGEVETFFDIDVTGRYGEADSLPSRFMRRHVGSMNIRTLLPDGTFSGSVILSNLFDMSLAGTYKIKVSKRFRLKDAKGEPVTITSNTLEVKVASDAPISRWDR